MSRRMDCPVCGATCTVNSFNRDGCWSCAAAKEQATDEDRFQSFMLLDDDARWRVIWEATGKPDPY